MIALKKLIVVLLILEVITMSACGINIVERPATVNINIEESNTGILIIDEHTWGVAGDKQLSNDNTYRFENLKAGDKVYGGYATLEVKKVTPDIIVLSVDGSLVEPNKDGTVNLLAESLPEIKLNIGNDIEVATQTMDFGAKLHIRYEYNGNKDT